MLLTCQVTVAEEGRMDKVQSADGTQVEFDRTGTGPALVLVVGAFNDRSSTKSLAARLASTFTVYEYDRRGRGDSGNTEPYAVAREVEDLGAVIAAAGGSAYAFGHSSGGALVLEAAAGGVPITRLAVYEPPYTEGPSSAFAAELAELAAAGQSSAATEAFLRLMGTPSEVLAQMKAGPYWAHMTAFAPTLAYEVWLCNDGSVPADRLASISAPTLALTGGASPAWAGDAVRAIAAAIPNGRFRVLEGQGHGVADEVIVPVLSEFFS
jgi:pimeloyl-ACP methyl ester carboxylesterase